MPRAQSKGRRGFIWLPRTAPNTWKIYINSQEVTTSIFSAVFKRAVCPEVGECQIDLINADSSFTDAFLPNQSIQFFIDFVDGSTLRFNGKIDSLKNVLDSQKGYVLEVQGRHITGDLYDINVTTSFYGDSNINSILNYLQSNYATFLTINFTSTYTGQPSLNWDSKPFWDCVTDLCKIANADAYVDDNYVLNFFDKGSISNDNEAIVWDDTLVELRNLGKQIITSKNKVTVIGDDGSGLPILSTKQDLASQALYGVKEQVIFDSKSNDKGTADDTAQSQLNVSANPDDEGEAESTILPSLSPGEIIWITNPPDKIHGQYRIYAFEHRLPEERTICTINKERSTKQVFKKRVENELASQALTNPYSMTDSINLTFDDAIGIVADANVVVTGGFIKLSSGSQGVFSTTPVTTSYNLSSVHLKCIGSNITPTIFQLSTDGGNNYQTLNLETLTTLTNPGNSIVFKVTIQSANTEIDSIALLYK